MSKRTLLFLGLLVLAALAAAWWVLRPAPLPEWIAAGNGRLEAMEVDVATKVAGRLLTLGPKEGDRVEAGQVVATLDAEDLAARLRALEAQVRQAREAAREARAGVGKATADARLAGQVLARTRQLVDKGFLSSQRLDQDRAAQQGADAALAAARTRVAEAEASVAAAEAQVESLRATLADSTLKAPISGRVLYRLAEPGEVLAAGGKALTLLDTSDFFMTLFLPTAEAGRVAPGTPARILLDAWPDEPIPARVSFVAPKAQFTPREVETRSEREKLMFRIKVRVDEEWLAAHQGRLNSGVPGMAYVSLDPARPWPEFLRLP
ncbi:HlyD family secretion protein [Azovibrio restrictus]|uniref:HlyD family secretion protein n=1 Tax=Azovibrio restrictus TaxID=146938 RepID=UPI0026E96B49|nr:efflux RND transporter periplasmic adaptor subunit [Azovibrio restrictus]